MRSTVGFLISAALLIFSFGCAKKPGFRTLEVPQEQARLHDLDNDSQDEFQEGDSEISSGDESLLGDPRDSGEEAAEPNIKTRSMGEIAKWVISHEAKKVGAACNFFIQRILDLMGFGKSDWTANEFDQYASEHFKSFEKKSFIADRDISNEREKLKQYLWSYPEKTGFIFQWKRPQGHGHIAVVLRIGDQLVIYHASLNTFVPKAQKVTIAILLHTQRKNLNVFSDFRK